MSNNNGMDWNQRVHVDPEENRRSMVPALVAIVALMLACGLGVYFGMFGSIILAGR